MVFGGFDMVDGDELVDGIGPGSGLLQHEEVTGTFQGPLGHLTGRQ